MKSISLRNLALLGPEGLKYWKLLLTIIFTLYLSVTWFNNFHFEVMNRMPAVCQTLHFASDMELNIPPALM